MKKIIKIITNKYFISFFVFIIWTLFFDQNDFMTIRERQKELDAVKGNIAFLNKEIVRMNNEVNELENNPDKLEKYARETFRIKHEGEDVYVIDKK